VSYQLGRWYRTLLYPDRIQLPEPARLSRVLDDCRFPGLIVAPLLREWFIYTPEEREGEVAAPNYTSSDIRWFVGNLVQQKGEETSRISVRQDRYVCWSNRIDLAGRNPVPGVEDPGKEWIVYMAWVELVLSHTPTDRKEGRIRRGYAAWFRKHFPDLQDPLGVIAWSPSRTS
jgi:hypothetical protein